MLKRFLQVRIILVLLELWYKGPQRCFRIPDEAEVQLGTASELFTAYIDLHNSGVLWEKLLIREVRANHQQRLAVHHCVIAGRKSEQTRHSHVERVVVLDELFPPHCMDDGGL